MVCNRDDAIKARQIAEKKLEVRDFVKAKQIALKAQQLDPGIDSISQIVAICDVHSTAEKKVWNCEMDWYAILQLDITANDASIKKQYRDLARLLHPDKNNFSGANNAFKLIEEAQRTLLDSEKRAKYDFLYKSFKNKVQDGIVPVRDNPNPNPSSRVVHTGFGNIIRSQSMRVDNNQTHRERTLKKSNTWECDQPHLRRAPTFRKSCPSCNMRNRDYTVKKGSFQCEHCKMRFSISELVIQGEPSRVSFHQSGVPMQNEAKTRSQSFRMPIQRPGSRDFSGTRSNSFHWAAAAAAASQPREIRTASKNSASSFVYHGNSDGRKPESDRFSTSSTKRSKPTGIRKWVCCFG